ncbi:MAG: threonine ammonia-lyase [Thermoprotei archaeon]|nr:MAG: threonine ammonia-lyase [Thermoprotei archaeon]
MGLDKLYKECVKAHEVISSYIHKTPLDRSATFSRMTGGIIYLKYENLQKTGAFKVRGALYKVYKIAQSSKSRGVIAASAGNHAQGVAYAASVFGLNSIIVMPETASISKIEATKSYGADVILYGKVYDEAYEKAKEIAEEKGYEFVHAFDDLDVIAGQGTIALEILKELSDIDVFIVQIGGGGLASGIATVIRKLRGSSVKIIGVEPENAPKMKMSIKAGKPVEIEAKPSLADGLVTKKPGDITFRIISELVDDIVTVSEDEIAQAMYLLLERNKILAEGAGAAGLAALLSGKINVRGKKVVTIISGGNVDLTAIYRIILRGLSSIGRIVSLRGSIPDVPGSLSRVLQIIAEERGNIVEIYHNRFEPLVDPWHAQVELIVEVPSIDIVNRIIKRLKSLGFAFKAE